MKLLRGNRGNRDYLLSQSFPLYRSHMHLYPPCVEMQVPPFLQGLGSQYLRSKREKVFGQKSVTSFWVTETLLC